MKRKKLSWGRLILNFISRSINKAVLWITAKFFAIMITIFISLKGRARMSHNNGIGARGKLRIVDNPSFPEHPFYVPGKEFPARLRHGSAAFLDDAMNCIRSISIKFADTSFKSPMDLEMNTGSVSLFWSAVSFLKFAGLRKEKWGVEYVEYMRKYPEGFKGAAVAVRREPTSFHNQHYYAKTPFLFTGSDQIQRYAKYRVLPYENIPETGIDGDPSFWDMSDQRVLPHTKLGRNYLKEEYENRLKQETLKYRLQIQTRIANDDDSREVFNNMKVWDERIYPWHDLAVLEMEEALDWRESTMMAFSVNNMPKSLGIIPATSIFDYNSLNYMRAHSEMARKARQFSYRLFGMVPAIPDNDNRNLDAGAWGK